MFICGPHLTLIFMHVDANMFHGWSPALCGTVCVDHLQRLIDMLSGLCGALACIGLYGVMSYTVSRRTGEISIRMAFGAKCSGVIWFVLWDLLRPVAIGLGVMVLAIVAGAPGCAI